jgi:hypothetical protein
VGMSFAPGGNAARSAISNGGLAGTRDGAPSQTGTIMITGLKNMNRTLIRFLKFSLNSLQRLARGLWTGYRIGSAISPRGVARVDTTQLAC